ncbi:MAG: putative ABC transporter permease [Candidatus Izemoplasmataceae bacterium]
MDQTIAVSKERSEVFAQGLCFYKLALIFIIGSFVGTLYEEIGHFLHRGFYESRSGVMFGPFNPIYGIGYVLMLLVLSRVRNLGLSVLVGAFVGGGFEYLASAGQEFFTGHLSWNYEGQFMNINGRTTVLYSLYWGLLGTFLVRGVYPILSNLVERMPPHTGKIVTRALIVFILINMLISYGALLRQHMRHLEMEPYTVVGEFFDHYYPDSRIYEAFPDMERLEE